MNEDAPKIRDLVLAICERLGLDPGLVRQLELTPRQARVTIFLTRDDGKKYVDPDTNEPATRVELVKVR